MYSKEEAKELTTLFWTSFGKYMGKHTSVYGKHIKWVNYKTGVRDVYVRLKADSKSAEIAIEFQHKDEDIRKLYYEQFTELKTVFTSIAGTWIWEEDVYNDFKHKISKVSIPYPSKMNIFNKEHWAACFQFFETHIVAFDAFWSDFNEIFKQLDD